MGLSGESMKTPTKVTIECTADGYTVSVYSGDETIASRSTRMEGDGRALEVIEQSGDWYSALPNFEELADELETGVPFSIAGVLHGFRAEERADREGE